MGCPTLHSGTLNIRFLCAYAFWWSCCRFFAVRQNLFKACCGSPIPGARLPVAIAVPVLLYWVVLLLRMLHCPYGVGNAKCARGATNVFRPWGKATSTVYLLLLLSSLGLWASMYALSYYQCIRIVLYLREYALQIFQATVNWFLLTYLAK